MKKTLWGVLSAICGIFAFYLTIGVIVAFLILEGMANATNVHATLFDFWWQTALFIADLVCCGGFLLFFSCYIREKKRNKKKKERVK